MKALIISFFVLGGASYAALPQASITDDYAQEYFGKQVCGGESLCKNKKENFNTPNLGCECPDIGQHYCYVPIEEEDCTEGCGPYNDPCVWDCGSQYVVSPCVIDTVNLECSCEEEHPECTQVQECDSLMCNGYCRYQKNPERAHEIACATLPPFIGFFCEPGE